MYPLPPADRTSGFEKKAEPGSGRKKILLVDDAELFLELEKSIFNRDDLDLTIALNGREALEIVGRQRPDLIFLDLLMPEMDGDECCRRLKSDPRSKDIPIVMVTAYRGEEVLDRCRAAGCEAILHKPLDRQRVMELTEKLLGLRGRQVDRVPARLCIRFGRNGSESLTDYSVNLSTGGMFIETAHILPEETGLRVEFFLPEGNVTVGCRARVAWTNPPDCRKSEQLPSGMGIQFLDLDLADLDLIRGHVRSGNIQPA